MSLSGDVFCASWLPVVHLWSHVARLPTTTITKPRARPRNNKESSFLFKRWYQCKENQKSQTPSLVTKVNLVYTFTNWFDRNHRVGRFFFFRSHGQELHRRGGAMSLPRAIGNIATVTPTENSTGPISMNKRGAPIAAGNCMLSNSWQVRNTMIIVDTHLRFCFSSWDYSVGSLRSMYMRVWDCWMWHQLTHWL
jgi:hypothetical protein